LPSTQVRKLKQLADQCSQSFTLQGMAESSFISTARFKGFALEAVYKVASSFWPNGQASHIIQHECGVQAYW